MTAQATSTSCPKRRSPFSTWRRERGPRPPGPLSLEALHCSSTPSSSCSVRDALCMSALRCVTIGVWRIIHMLHTGRLYVLGGGSISTSSSSVTSSAVYFRDLNVAGSSWQTGVSMQEARTRHGAVVSQGDGLLRCGQLRAAVLACVH